MGKLLFWIVIILVALFAVRLINHQKNKRARTPTAPPTPKATLGKSEEMVRCHHCGVYLPRSEAVLKSGHLWCSKEHADQGTPRP